MISCSDHFQVSIVPISSVPTSNVWSHRRDDKLGLMTHHSSKLPVTSLQLLVYLRIRVNLKVAQIASTNLLRSDVLHCRSPACVSISTFASAASGLGSNRPPINVVEYVGDQNGFDRY